MNILPKNPVISMENGVPILLAQSAEIVSFETDFHLVIKEDRSMDVL